MIVLHLFQLVTRLNSNNSKETLIRNELCQFKLYMNTRISNWHIWSIDHKNMSFLPLFHFETRLRIYKHPNLFST